MWIGANNFKILFLPSLILFPIATPDAILPYNSVDINLNKFIFDHDRTWDFLANIFFEFDLFLFYLQQVLLEMQNLQFFNNVVLERVWENFNWEHNEGFSAFSWNRFQLPELVLGLCWCDLFLLSYRCLSALFVVVVVVNVYCCLLSLFSVVVYLFVLISSLVWLFVVCVHFHVSVLFVCC